MTVAATCLEEGATVYVCSLCDDVLIQVIPKLTTHTYTNACDTECNVCGETREAEHKFSAQWSRNSSQHWHACTLCGEKSDVGGHFAGPAATEDKDQICLTCGYILTYKLGHKHKYATVWTSDKTGHWYACEGCEDKGEFEAHTYDNSCDSDCNECGYVTETAHSMDGDWVSDETGHWLVCSACGEKGKLEEHVANSDADETEKQLCLVCNFELAAAQDHTHEPGEAWESDDNGHWHACECGEKVDAAPHIWDEGTENEDGTVTYVCSECLAEKTEEAEEAEEEESSGFPWGIVMVILVIALIATVAALVMVLRSGKSSGKFKE